MARPEWVLRTWTGIKKISGSGVTETRIWILPVLSRNLPKLFSLKVYLFIYFIVYTKEERIMLQESACTLLSKYIA